MKVLFLFLLSILLSTNGCISSLSYWEAKEANIYNKNKGNVGIGTLNPENKLTIVDESTIPVKNFTGLSSVISSPTESRAIYGSCINPNGTNNYGGYFTSKGESSGIFGEATDMKLGIAGGIFNSYGEHGKGVMGIATNENNVTNYGGWFDARGEVGVGIYAEGGNKGYAAQFRGNVQILNRRSGEIILELGQGLDLSEGFNINSLEKKVIDPGTVVIIDNENPGKVKVSDNAYDHRVAGVVAGARDLGSGIRLGAKDFDVYVGLVGRVYCNVEATSEAIMPGDLLTTSYMPGYAMKVVDIGRSHGCILGKAMESIDKGKIGQILVLVTLQ